MRMVSMPEGMVPGGRGGESHAIFDAENLLLFDRLWRWKLRLQSRQNLKPIQVFFSYCSISARAGPAASLMPRTTVSRKIERNGLTASAALYGGDFSSTCTMRPTAW